MNPDPHWFLFPDPTGPQPGPAITLAGQQQIAEFFATDAWRVPNVNAVLKPLFGKNLFELIEVLPEELNY